MTKCVVSGSDLKESTMTFKVEGVGEVTATALPDSKGYLPRFSNFPKGKRVVVNFLKDAEGKFYFDVISFDKSAMKPVSFGKAVDLEEAC